MWFSLLLNSAHTNRFIPKGLFLTNSNPSTKQAYNMAPAAGTKGKAKKKWSKGKGTFGSHVEGLFLQETNILYLLVKDKAQHAVILDKATSDKLNKDVQSYRLITVAVLVDRLKINGSVARRALADLEERGLIKKVVGHSKLSIYSTLCPIPSAMKTIHKLMRGKC